MKTFPSIPHWSPKLFGTSIHAFYKEDGSNIRVEYNRKQGFYKFGTKKILIDSKDPYFGSAIGLFMNKYSEDLIKVLDKREYKSCKSFVFFMEYLGENSFAGQHVDTDKKDVILFDVSQYKRGFINPSEFIDNFGHLHIPELIYKGQFDQEFVDYVKKSTTLGEGVMCKFEKNKVVYQFKLKTDNWLDKLKNKFGEDAILEEFKWTL